MATYYVESGHGGSDAGTAANPWLTIDQAMNAVGAGDKVWVKASVDYTELVTIDTAGAANTPIVFEGYTTATGDGGRATITGSGARTSCITDSIGADTDIFYVFKNFRMTDATGSGFDSDCDHITFKNCKFDTNGTHGCVTRISVHESCEYMGNTSSGLELGGSAVVVGSTFYSNLVGLGASGISFTVLGCTFFSNSQWGIAMGSGGGSSQVVANCVIDGDGKDTDIGIRISNDLAVLGILNTVVYDCTTGISAGGGDMGERIVSRNNCVNANTANYVDIETFTGEVTAAPDFVDEVAGADYTPNTGSPLVAAGYDLGPDMDIGAIQVTAGGGGGGLLMPNKRAGKQ
ncbi:hypothetical protein LCGC14_1915300 [marine sediment metagenome]|uniref:Right handed beta helix domain-containing protein n=1 Tax=marine sediment metagenome TaxID=412755 RepID=A0A0F9IQD9_9ZZZZ